MTDANHPNADQADFWNRPGGETWTTQRDHFNAMLGSIGDEAIARARPQPGEHVLDVGCGTGHTTSDLARRVAPGGSVMGLDISALMLQGARRFNVKEQIIHGRIYRNIAELRDAVRDFVELYNAQWIVEKNGYLSPAQARQAWHAAISIRPAA